MENKNLIWILLGLGVVGLVIFLIIKRKKMAETDTSIIPESPTKTPDVAPADMGIVKYYADDPRVNPDIVYLQKQINLQTVGANPYRLTAVIADGKLGDKTATEIEKVDAVIGKEVKARRAITKDQMRAIIRKIGEGWI